MTDKAYRLIAGERETEIELLSVEDLDVAWLSESHKHSRYTPAKTDRIP